MFKYELYQKYTPGVLLGLFNIDQIFISSIKPYLNSVYKNNINYLEITKEILKKPKLKRIKDTNYDELGMISINWMEKFQNSIPGLIIQMIDITNSIIDTQNVDINPICETIIKNIQLIRSAYHGSNQLIIIQNYKKVNGLENNIKNNILKFFKNNIKENSIFFINVPLYVNNQEIMKQIGKLIIDDLYSFYNIKIQLYFDKYNSQKNNELKEYAIKYLIKMYLLFKITNIQDDNKKINYFDYIKNAYKMLKKIDKKNYMFCNNDLKVKYLEIKNLADFLLYQILSDKILNKKKSFSMIIKHLYKFDSKNFFGNDKNDINNNALNKFKNSKDIAFINLKWKFSWLKYLLEIIGKENKLINENKILNYYIINNLYHLYIFLKKEPNFTKEIYSNINKELVTKKIKPKYIEKVPKLYEMEGENIVGLLSDEENLGFYISDIISENNNLTNSEYILKSIKEYFNNNNLNYYDFYLINKHWKENQFNEDFNNVLIKILNQKSNNIYKFKNVYSHISNKINKIVLEMKIEKGNKDYSDIIYKMIEHFIFYASLSKKEFSKEEIIQLNEFLTYDFNLLESENKIIHLDNFENRLFNIQINYNIKEVTLLDIINIDINISLVRKELLMNIEKIIIYFPGQLNNKAIIINKELSQDKPININLKYLIKSYFTKFYITNIELYLKNKIVINLFNKDKKDIIFYNKDNNRINVDDIINFGFISDKICVGKNENHLFNFNYNLKINKKDIFIRNIKINIQVEGTKNYEFKILEGVDGYNISVSKQIFYEYDNTNLDTNLPQVEYILKIRETGSYKLKYKFFFTLINNNCPNESCILESNKNLTIESIESIIFTYDIQSPLYFIDSKTKSKSYPINYPIGLTSYIENQLSEKIIINKILHLPSSNTLEIKCNSENLFYKIKNFKIQFSQKEKISINAKIQSNTDFVGLIGKLKIFWASENLYNNKHFSESLNNFSIFDLNDINIKMLPLIIEGKYLKLYNKYQIDIKNMESISKIIQLNINEDNNDEKFILCGKKNLKGVLTPNKEINLLFNVYDTITGEYLQENNVYKYNNIFIINEYDISNDKNTFQQESLKNVIYFSPEIFKLS